MALATMQTQNDLGLKEWGVVCAALGAGQQIILLRKGGIAEGPGGFQVERREFWLLPTDFHQHLTALDPQARPLWEETRASAPADNRIPIGYYALATDVFQITQEHQLAKLAGQHVFSSATVSERFHYRRPGLFVLAVRVYRAPRTIELFPWPELSGCRSWVELPEPLSTANAKPVLDDQTFAARLAALRSVIAARD